MVKLTMTLAESTKLGHHTKLANKQKDLQRFFWQSRPSGSKGLPWLAVQSCTLMFELPASMSTVLCCSVVLRGQYAKVLIIIKSVRKNILVLNCRNFACESCSS